MTPVGDHPFAGERVVRCVAVYLPSGIDLRLLAGGDMLRTVLCHAPWSLKDTARVWLEALAEAS